MFPGTNQATSVHAGSPYAGSPYAGFDGETKPRSHQSFPLYRSGHQGGNQGQNFVPGQAYSPHHAFGSRDGTGGYQQGQGTGFGGYPQQGYGSGDGNTPYQGQGYV